MDTDLKAALDKALTSGNHSEALRLLKLLVKFGD